MPVAGMNEKIKFVLVAGPRLLREDIHQMLVDEPTIKLVRQAANGMGLIHLLPPLASRCSADGLTETGNGRLRNGPVVEGALSPHSRVNPVGRQFRKTVGSVARTGRVALLSQNVGKEELTYAIQKVAAGEVYLGTDLTTLLFR